MQARGQDEAEWDAPLARKRAMDLLARREHSLYELQQKLVSKGCPVALADEAVAGLAADELVSDARCAESLVGTRARQGHGPLRILRDLKDKRVAGETIDEYLDARENKWFVLASKVRVQKFGAGWPQDFATRAKQARFLQSRGFGAEHIRAALKDDLDGLDEDFEV